MTDACSFEACAEVGDHRVIVTAADAASWALNPGLLELIDRETTDDPVAAIGLMFCGPHAAGVEREHFQARSRGLSVTEQRVLKHLQSQQAAGGDTIEATAGKLRLSESAVGTMMRRLTKAGVVVRSKSYGFNRGRHRVPKWMAVTDQHEPPPVQPTLGMDGEPS